MCSIHRQRGRVPNGRIPLPRESRAHDRFQTVRDRTTPRIPVAKKATISEMTQFT